MRHGWGAAAVMLMVHGASAAEERRPLVLELFTSEGCSSCPPADALLGELARDRPDVLPLAFHITYWDRLGWTDPYALPASTARQEHYAAFLSRHLVYTPQMVIEGTQDVVGSDRAAVVSALRDTAAAAAAPISLHRATGEIAITLGAGRGAGTVLLFGFDHAHRTAVHRGENGGRTLDEANIVRSITPAGRWTGVAASWHAALPPGEDFAAIVQADDQRILGAARLAAEPLADAHP